MIFPAMKPSNEVRIHVSSRCAPWLSGILKRGGIGEAELTKAMRSDPEDRDTAPRKMVKRWLAPGSFISAYKAFEVGQALAKIPSVIPATGGLMALHAVGYFAESLAMSFAMLKRAFADEKKARTYEARRDARGRIDYALTFICAAWTAHSDLDGLAKVFPMEKRADARAIIGNAPLEACEMAWNERGDAGRFGAALLEIASTATSSPYRSGLIAWRALFEFASQCALQTPAWATAWSQKRIYFERYMEVVHREILTPPSPDIHPNFS